jgi:hypothetical protein
MAQPTDANYHAIPAGERWFTDAALGSAPRQETTRTVLEPAREIPVHDETDVLVVGGGPAGCAAAAAARRAGARVTLLERYNHLGGLSTGGLVIWIDRMTDWNGTQVIAGVGQELLDRLPRDAVAGAPPAEWGSTDGERVEHWRQRLGAFRGTVTWSPVIDPEWLKYVSAELMTELGVHLILHSWVVATLVDDQRVHGVVFESKQGRRAVLAKVVVDASGDLDVCAQAGSPYQSDLEGEAGTVAHCLNTAFTWAGVDVARWLSFRSDPDAFSRFTNQAKGDLGFAEMPFVGWRDDVVVFMGPRLAGYSGLQVEDLTRVELDSRRRMMAHLAFFRSHAPGFEHAWALLSGSQVGVRHTRRLIGQHALVSNEWMEGIRHDDEIGVSPSPSQAFANVSIPYGALVPANLDNVLVGGRHIATDPQSQAFMREIPQCWMTGQAAGAAAALAADSGSAARDLAVGSLQQELRRQGVYLSVPERTSYAAQRR